MILTCRDERKCKEQKQKRAMGDLGAAGFVIPVSFSVLGVLGKKWGEEMASPLPFLKSMSVMLAQAS